MSAEVWGVLAFLGASLLCVGLFAGYVYFWKTYVRRTAQERHELVEMATLRGWSYTDRDRGWGDRFAGNSPFMSWSKNMPVYDVVTGTYRGRPFCAFEYRRKSRLSGSKGVTPGMVSLDQEGNLGTSIEYFRIIALGTPTHRPTLEVRKRGLGMHTINFSGVRKTTSGHPQFDKVFQVATDHEQFARDLLTAHVTNYLLGDQRTRQQPLRFERDELVTWQRGRLKAPTLEPTLDYLADVLDQVPAMVWR
jgi:hypothetical protein